MEADAKVVDAIGQQAVNKDRERLTALQAAFADNPQLALDAFTKGWTVDQAKAAQYESLKAENEALKSRQSEDGNRQPTVGYAATPEKESSAATSEDQVETVAMAIWNRKENQDLREEFAGNKSWFLADYKANPEEYSNRKR